MAAFDADRGAVLDRAAQAGVTRLLVPAVDLPSARSVVAMAENKTHVFAAVGIHPSEVASVVETDFADLEPLALLPKVVAIGEIGLDYYWIADPELRSQQRRLLRTQLNLARAAQKPVVLHMREEKDADEGVCSQDMLRILEDWVMDLPRESHTLWRRPGVLHSFSGTLATALKAIDLGFHIGVTGPVTFPNAEKRRKLVAALPLERILIETDAPFLAPQSHRGHRNEPAFVADIADRIAQVHSRSMHEVADITSANAARLFDWGVFV
jgi:TatD DNase family protein